MRSTKFQAPSSKETPNSKLQLRQRSGYCDLVIGDSLVLGAWRLELSA
jgi:hypothetical protein